MPLQPQVRTATLKTNVNLKTTVHTRQNIGDSTMVSDNVEARVLGIPGTNGRDGAQALNWKGEFNINTSYVLNDLVNLDGATFIYVSETAGIIEIPSQTTTTWHVFTGTPQMRVEIDELPNGDLIVGKSLPDSGLNEAKWSIKKVLFVGEDMSIIWADDVSTYIKIWNDRLDYFP